MRTANKGSYPPNFRILTEYTQSNHCVVSVMPGVLTVLDSPFKSVRCDSAKDLTLDLPTPRGSLTSEPLGMDGWGLTSLSTVQIISGRVYLDRLSAATQGQESQTKAASHPITVY